MPRADLMALGEADMEAFTNRGTVKRALKELDGGKLSCSWDEADDGTVKAVWW